MEGLCSSNTVNFLKVQLTFLTNFNAVSTLLCVFSINMSLFYFLVYIRHKADTCLRACCLLVCVLMSPGAVWLFCRLLGEAGVSCTALSNPGSLGHGTHMEAL